MLLYKTPFGLWQCFSSINKRYSKHDTKLSGNPHLRHETSTTAIPANEETYMGDSDIMT